MSTSPIDVALLGLRRVAQLGSLEPPPLVSTLMQGVIKAYDPVSALGVVMCDTDLADYDLATDALEGSIFRMVRQGQRVVFDLDDAGRATHLRLGSEIDMGTPGSH